MGLTSSKIVEHERIRWNKPHSLLINQNLRKTQLDLLNKFSRNLRLCFVKKLFNRTLEYEEWYVTDGKWSLKFELYGNVTISNNPPPNGGILQEEFRLTNEVVLRMVQVCGGSNFSLALRNSEHLARYIQSGCWISMQMLGMGPLKAKFLKEMGSHAKYVNTLPEECSPPVAQLRELYPRYTKQKIFFERNVKALLETANNAYNVVILGPTGSGKSSIINQLFNSTVAHSASGAKSVTREVVFYQGQCQMEMFNEAGNKIKQKSINVVDTIGFCDSVMTSQDVLEVIKHSLKMNIGFIDKVLIVCSGRMEKTHVESIKNFMRWLSYNEYKHKFCFIYSKCDGLTEAEKLTNLSYMCDQLNAPTKSQTRWRSENGQVRQIQTNLALGFPRDAQLSQVEKDLNKLVEATLAVYPEQRIPINKSACNIL